MIFFDACIPRPVANAFKLDRQDVVWKHDVFAQGTKDREWLPKVGEWGWLVITRDKKIRTRPAEREAILENGVGCFILASNKNLTKPAMIALVGLTLPQMERLFSITPRPFIFTIDVAGQFRRYA